LEEEEVRLILGIWASVVQKVALGCNTRVVELEQQQEEEEHEDYRSQDQEVLPCCCKRVAE
jgi:hypothetical protein